MKEYAKEFYKSVRWQKTREAYLKSVGYLCERCKQNGIIKTAEIVHHKTYLTPSNIKDGNIALSFDNLEALCRDCHNAEHFQKHYRQSKRYSVAKDGRVRLLPAPIETENAPKLDR